jgi:hypothetical protein
MLTAVLNLDRRAEEVATNIVLPAGADQIMLDGAAVSAAKPFEKPAGPESVVGVREGSAAVAIRIFYADGEQPQFVLRADKEGLRWGAARYTVYHHLKEQKIRVGLLIRAAKCSSDTQFADLMRMVREAKPALELARPRITPAVLSVNGEDVSLATFLGKR